MAHPRGRTALWEVPAWKSATGTVAAVLLAIIFLVAGVWKITDPIGAAARLTQAQIPGTLSLPAALLLGIGETFTGVLLVLPRFRRWGAWLATVSLVAFMAYVGFHYDVLRGEECNCFPWIKRAVGPGFFVADALMLVLALIAGWWSKPSQGRRSAALVLAAVSVFALVSYGVSAVRQAGVRAPASIVVDGKPFSLLEGRIVLYFFDPECAHCDKAARDLAKLDWRDTKLIAVPTARPQFAQEFVKSTGLPAAISYEAEKLRATFSFGDPPYAVALERGRQRAALARFDAQEPAATLRRLGLAR